MIALVSLKEVEVIKMFSGQSDMSAEVRKQMLTRPSLHPLSNVREPGTSLQSIADF